MKKINNKGMTVVEIIVCFALASIIIVSMFELLNSYKNKEDEESFKTSINTYKTTLTKVIYDDIIKNHGVSKAESNQSGDTFVIRLTFKNNTTKDIEVYNKTMCITITRDSNHRRIETPNQICRCLETDSNGECIKTNELNIDTVNSEYYVIYGEEKYSLPKISGLTFNDIIAEQKDNGFIVIHIGLNHNDYGNKYDALNIVVPNVNVYQGMFY